MRIKELSERVGVSTRLLRYYEEQGLITPRREENGYRCYDEAAVERVEQIRGLLGAGLTTEIIREVLPCLGAAACSQYDDPEFVRRIAAERDRLRERVTILMQHVNALDDYLGAVSQVAPSVDAA
ncbi:MerR family transcriptional regulator [Actinacidiphila glaucinigra]|uniref:MerR family transcriptional regulator n=1 Tax=Streptomycetaceae TaxID=2062 RepID=UPI002DDB5D3D|nr:MULTISPECIES: MerR family transcriptional regulator [Streptomycetaceae]WSD57498.1 MerR family transcriptional regulator [Actinacidiphila glaucinigra]WSD65147.1 MerR family transcriptional regulator [Actinacidiphila glaucinigra]WUB50280.1 MerR family transcriptional regulator [Streptomyces griseorubiginosus]